MILRLALPLCLAVLVAAGLGTPLWAQNANSAPDRNSEPSVRSREVPKLSSPVDQFDFKSTDSGSRVQQRLEFNLPDSKDTFIFGNKSTTYALPRRPGQETEPTTGLPPQDRYSIGIGRRF